MSKAVYDKNEKRGGLAPKVRLPSKSIQTPCTVCKAVRWTAFNPLNFKCKECRNPPAVGKPSPGNLVGPKALKTRKTTLAPEQSDATPPTKGGGDYENKQDQKPPKIGRVKRVANGNLPKKHVYDTTLPPSAMRNGALYEETSDQPFCWMSETKAEVKRLGVPKPSRVWKDVEFLDVDYLAPVLLETDGMPAPRATRRCDTTLLEVPSPISHRPIVAFGSIEHETLRRQNYVENLPAKLTKHEPKAPIVETCDDDVDSRTPMQIAYSKVLVETDSAVSIFQRVMATPDLTKNESAIDAIVFNRCMGMTVDDFDVSSLHMVSRCLDSNGKELVQDCMDENWIRLPRLIKHHHPVCHDIREILLLKFYLSGTNDIYDLGGSAHRWHHVLMIHTRLRMLGFDFPLRKIHVNAPEFANPFMPSPVHGSFEDSNYLRRSQHTMLRFPEVFTTCDPNDGPQRANVCSCVWGMHHCDHWIGKTIVCVDSVYYVTQHLPRAADIHVIAHEYNLPIGALGINAATAEQNWEVNGGIVSVKVGSKHCTYEHENIKLTYGWYKNFHDEAWSVRTIREFSPWGDAHRYAYTVWTPQKSIPNLGRKVIQDVYSLTTEMREGTPALASKIQTAVRVIDTGHTVVMVPSAAISVLSIKFPSTAKLADVHTAAFSMVNQCSAINPRMADIAITYLTQNHERSHHLRFSAVFGNRTLLAFQFWWHALASVVLFTLFALWIDSILSFLWLVVSIAVLVFANSLVGSLCVNTDPITLDAPGSRQTISLGITREDYGLAPARYLLSAYIQARFTYQVLTGYPGLILDNWNRAKYELGHFPRLKHENTTISWCSWACSPCWTWCQALANAFNRCCCANGGYAIVADENFHPLSLLNALARRGWDYNPLELLRGYVAIVGGDDVSAVSTRLVTAAHLELCKLFGYPLTGNDTTDSHGDPSHNSFFSSVPVPMWNHTTNAQCHVMVPKFGRFLSRSHFAAKPIPQKYVMGRVKDNATCYQTYFGKVPVFGPMVEMWKRVATEQTDKPKFNHNVRGDTVKTMYRFVEKPMDDDIRPYYVTYDWIVEHYDQQFTVVDLLDFENVISKCPGTDFVIHHPVAKIMIETDTDYQVPLRKTAAYLPMISAGLEEFTAFSFKVMTGQTGAWVSMAIGIIESALTGWSVFPLVAHLVQAMVVWYGGATLGLFTHVAWNYQWTHKNNGYYTKVTQAQLSATRICCPQNPFPDPDALDPTFSMTVAIGNKKIYTIPARQHYTLERSASKHCGQSVWLTTKEDIPERKLHPRIGSWEEFAKYPCRSSCHNAPGAQWLVSGCFAEPCVLSGCLRNTVLGALHRRAKPSPEVSPDVEEAWVKHLLEQNVPLLIYLRSCEELHWEPQRLFEWWRDRPGFATEPRKLQLTKAFHELQQGIKIDFTEARTFCKIQMECSSGSPMNEFLPVYEPDTQKGPRCRGVTCISDYVAVLRGPTTQMVAKLLGPCFGPGQYEQLPGCIHKTNSIWMKGSDPVAMGDVINKAFAGMVYSDGTDASAFDKNHTMSTRRAVDLAWEFYPKSTKDILKDIKYVSKTRMTSDVGSMTLTYSQQGGMLSGEPDTSLTNTLIRMALDRIMHSCSQQVGPQPLPHCSV